MQETGEYVFSSSGVNTTSYSVTLLSATEGAIVSSAHANVPATSSSPYLTTPPVSSLSASVSPYVMPAAEGAVSTEVSNVVYSRTPAL